MWYTDTAYVTLAPASLGTDEIYLEVKLGRCDAVPSNDYDQPMSPAEMEIYEVILHSGTIRLDISHCVEEMSQLLDIENLRAKIQEQEQDG